MHLDLATLSVSSLYMLSRQGIATGFQPLIVALQLTFKGYNLDSAQGQQDLLLLPLLLVLVLVLWQVATINKDTETTGLSSLSTHIFVKVLKIVVGLWSWVIVYSVFQSKKNSEKHRISLKAYHKYEISSEWGQNKNGRSLSFVNKY